MRLSLYLMTARRSLNEILHCFLVVAEVVAVELYANACRRV